MMIQTHKQTMRCSNIELLRIIAMFLIVAHHFAIHSDFDYPSEIISINRLWVQLVLVGGKIGVNVFIMISGYFLVTSPSVRFRKVFKMWFQVFFYSIVIFLLLLLFKAIDFNVKELVKALIPVLSSRWWFISNYFALYILSPYINKLLNSLSRRQYLEFLVILFLFFSFIPTFTGLSYLMNSLVWFIFLYSIAGYFRLYGTSTRLSSIGLIVCSLVCMLLTFMSAVVLDLMGTKYTIFADNATYFYGMHKLPILVTAVLLFMGFITLNIPSCRIINTISSATLGVYLIHDHPYVSEFLWKTFLNSVSYADSAMLIPYSLIVIILVYVVCTVIELLRKQILEKNYITFVDNFSDVLEMRLSSFEDSVVFRLEQDRISNPNNYKD